MWRIFLADVTIQTAIYGIAEQFTGVTHLHVPTMQSLHIHRYEPFA